MVRRLMMLALLAVVVGLAVLAAPDIARYMKLKEL